MLNKLIMLLIFSVLSLNCGGYYTLRSDETIVQYFENQNQFVIINTQSVHNDSSWQSEYCTIPMSTAKTLKINLGDSIEKLLENNIVPDTSFIKMIRGEKYLIHRYFGCFPFNNGCACNYYLPDSLAQITRWHKYVDLYFDSNVLEKIKYKFIGP